MCSSDGATATASSDKTEENDLGYAPDLPGCIATGDTPRETEDNMREASRFHLEWAGGGRLAHPARPTRASFRAFARTGSGTRFR